MKRLETTILCVFLLGGCASEFSPVLEEEDETDTGDFSDEDTDEEVSTDEGSTDDSGDTSGTEDTGSDEDTGETSEPPSNPGLNEPCDPFLAFEGIAPCEDPNNPNADLTCAIVRLMPDINTTAYEFRCLSPGDGNGDGSDLGDNCSDDGGGQAGAQISTGCLNSFCLWNGLGNDPVNDDPWGHPPGECPFVLPDDMGYSSGCCTTYCNADHPCDPGWTCQMGAPAVGEIPDGVGACVWL
jgi:hypothetical protein